MILEAMKNDPTVTAVRLSKILDINLRNTKKHIKDLKDKQLIRRVGPKKGGHWEALE